MCGGIYFRSLRINGDNYQVFVCAKMCGQRFKLIALQAATESQASACGQQGSSLELRHANTKLEETYFKERGSKKKSNNYMANVLYYNKILSVIDG